MNTQEKFNEGMHEIDAIISELRSLGSSFSRTGNDNMAKTLWATANRLEEAHTKATDAMHETVGEMFKAAQQSSRTMLEAALAGSELARRDPQPGKAPE